VNSEPPSSISTAADLRQATVLAAGLGVAGLIVMIVVGRPWAGFFAVLGLGLGLLNAIFVRRAAAKFATADSPSKGSFAGSAMVRLAVVSLVALVFALIIRPDGLGVFIGLAAFQLIMIGVGLVPLLKELRSSEGLGK
jgi:hypothetical protein